MIDIFLYESLSYWARELIFGQLTYFCHPWTYTMCEICIYTETQIHVAAVNLLDNPTNPLDNSNQPQKCTYLHIIWPSIDHTSQLRFTTWPLNDPTTPLDNYTCLQSDPTTPLDNHTCPLVDLTNPLKLRVALILQPVCLTWPQSHLTRSLRQPHLTP